MSDVTKILSRIEQGAPGAAEELLPLVYAELRTLAASRLSEEPSNQTLQATALVHEAYLRLVKDPQANNWNSTGHFFGAAAEAMRRILVDRARAKATQKRGGNWSRVNFETLDVMRELAPDQVLAIDESLALLHDDDEIAGKLVELRYFAGLTLQQAAQAIGISSATAYRHWAYARAWLHHELIDTEI